MTTFQTFYTSPVGVLKLRCSDSHLQAVLFADEASGLQDEHPLLVQCRTQLDAYFSGQCTAFQLPLLQSGTAFQEKVWTLLGQIPYGKTISYQQLSRQYGDVKAIRAVAAANGRNNLAIIIPCHRVIGTNQTLTGYAGGLWRKKWLLEHEAKHYSGVAQLQFSI